MYEHKPIQTLKKISKDATTQIYLFLNDRYNDQKYDRIENPHIMIINSWEFNKLGFNKKTIYRVLKELEDMKCIKVKQKRGTCYKIIELLNIT